MKPLLAQEVQGEKNGNRFLVTNSPDTFPNVSAAKSYAGVVRGRDIKSQPRKAPEENICNRSQFGANVSAAKSYAGVVRGRAINSRPQNTPEATRNASVPEESTQNDASFASELREMMRFMREMMQQMSAMTTLLVNLTSKISSAIP
jgi:hypothetical protein